MKAKRNNKVIKVDTKTNNKIKTKNNKVTKKVKVKKPQKPKTTYNYSEFKVRRAITSHNSVILNIPAQYCEQLKLQNSNVKIRVVGSKLVINKISPRLD